MKVFGWGLVALAVLIFIAMIAFAVLGIWISDARWGWLATLAFFVMFAPGVAGASMIDFARSKR